MTAAEAALLTALLGVLAAAGYTDCKKGVIYNKMLLPCGGAAVAIDLLYYSLWAGDYLAVFLGNVVLLGAVSAVLYCCHLWAAGDSKLLFVAALLIPGRFYTFWDIGPVAGFTIVVFAFSIAFVCVVVESVVLTVKDRVRLRSAVPRVDWRRAAASYAAAAAFTALFNRALLRTLGTVLADSPILLTAVDFLAVLVLLRLRDRLSTRWLTALAVVLWTVRSILWVAGQGLPGRAVDLRSWAVVLAMVPCRWMAERFNYRTIPASEVCAGQILSAATVAGFQASRVKGLPTGMTEDLRARITAQQAESVRRWAASAHGRDSVVIVRKIPFALFIGLGTLCFIILEVAML